jgi:hypothetical protein
MVKTKTCHFNFSIGVEADILSCPHVAMEKSFKQKICKDPTYKKNRRPGNGVLATLSSTGIVHSIQVIEKKSGSPHPCLQCE